MSAEEWLTSMEQVIEHKKPESAKHGFFIVIIMLFAIAGFNQYLNRQIGIYQQQLDEHRQLMQQQKNAVGDESGAASEELGALVSTERASIRLLAQIGLDLASHGLCLESIRRKNSTWEMTVMAISHQQIFKKIRRWQQKHPARQMFVNRVVNSSQGKVKVEIKIKDQQPGFVQYIKRKSKTLF